MLINKSDNMKTINVNKTCRIAVFSLACCLAAPSWADDLNRGEWGVRYESQAVMQKELVRGVCATRMANR